MPVLIFHSVCVCVCACGVYACFCVCVSLCFFNTPKKGVTVYSDLPHSQFSFTANSKAVLAVPTTQPACAVACLLLLSRCLRLPVVFAHGCAVSPSVSLNRFFFFYIRHVDSLDFTSTDAPGRDSRQPTVVCPRRR